MILLMHCCGTVLNDLDGINRIAVIAINSIGNMGVTCFMLISGYFGVRTNYKKAYKIWITTMCYSVISTILQMAVNRSFSVKGILKACIPISTNMYWYISCYILLLIFADYINQISKKLEKTEFRKLLLSLIIIFSVIPTAVQSNIMGDSGKGPINMFLIYLIGRYISKYTEEVRKREWKYIFIIVIVFEFILNCAVSFLRKGIYVPFARDYSIFIITSSVAVFMIFLNMRAFECKILNSLAQNVIAIYLLEGVIRNILVDKVRLNKFVLGEKFIVIIIWVALVLMVLCTIIEIVRRRIFGQLEDKLWQAVSKINYARIIERIRNKNG